MPVCQEYQFSIDKDIIKEHWPDAPVHTLQPGLTIVNFHILVFINVFVLALRKCVNFFICNDVIKNSLVVKF